MSAAKIAASFRSTAGMSDHPLVLRPQFVGREPGAGDERFELGPDDIDDDSLTLVEGREPGSFKGRDVDEHVLSTAIASNEAEALLDVESLHGADFLDRPGNRAARSSIPRFYS
jgi:hypothetical protein